MSIYDTKKNESSLSEALSENLEEAQSQKITQAVMALQHMEVPARVRARALSIARKGEQRELAGSWWSSPLGMSGGALASMFFIALTLGGVWGTLGRHQEKPIGAYSSSTVAQLKTNLMSFSAVDVFSVEDENDLLLSFKSEDDFFEDTELEIL